MSSPRQALIAGRVAEEAPCVFETPVATRPPKRVHASVTNLRSSQKRRRMSMQGNELGEVGEVGDERVAGPSRPVIPVSDRFIPSRPKTALPLNITPRTNRISKQFGLVDDRVLSFRGSPTKTTTSSSPSRKDTMSLLRRSASSLFATKPTARPTSVVENLSKRRQSLMVLDSPGVPLDAEAYPISWSRENLIAVACKDDVYFQDLDSKAVTHLCNASQLGALRVLQWAGEERPRDIALGLTTGVVALWDAEPRRCKDKWYIGNDEDALLAVKSLAWNRDLLVVGLDGGVISMMDLRGPRAIPTEKKHQASVLSLQWSADRTYLASGDRDGVVQVWDVRNGKSLLDDGAKPASKMRHKGSARAMAWCPWKPDLLATGSTAPEGMIKIWSTSNLAPHSPDPIKTLELNTSVHSLIWSPHCKELLSTHGPSFTKLPAPARQRTLSLPANPFSALSSSVPLTPALSAHDIVNTLPASITTPMRTPRLLTRASTSSFASFTSTATSSPTTTTPNHNTTPTTSSTSSHTHTSTRTRTRTSTPRKPTIVPTSSPLSNALAVHAFPSLTRLLALPKAHAGPVTQSAVGPTGECVFTLCPAEEAIKMWQVWGRREEVRREESAFERWRIR